MIIVFSGLDGSGKSTQIKHLDSWISEQGYSSTLLWARGGYTPGFELFKRILRLLLRKKLPQSGKSSLRESQLSKPFIAKLWLSIAILDLMVYWGIYLRYQLLVGNIVICDRFLDDTRLDFYRNFPKISFEESILWKMLCFVTPRANRSFLLWVPVSESVRRGKLKDEPFPDDAETLEWRLSFYLDDNEFPKSQYLKIDCSNSIDEVSAEILNSVQQLIND